MSSLIGLNCFPKPLDLFWLALFVLSLPGCNSQPYQLIPTRPFPEDPLSGNTLQLQCRNLDNFGNLPVEDAMFWVDNTNKDLRDLLRDQGSEPVYIGSDTFQFTIIRELEGHYFCGPNVQHTSPMVVQYALPLSSEVPTSVTVTVQEGSDVTLHPLISPGALQEIYYIDWRMNSTSVTLVQIEIPRNQATMTNGRYSVDPDSFALTIQSVQFEDRGLYLGELGVRDPGGMTFMYERLLSTGITLDVFVSPTFLESPTTQVVSTEDTQSANFTCRVQAYPRPTITWYHEEDQIFDGDNYMISETNSMQDGLDIVKSIVVVLGLTSENSGQIKCVATGISVQDGPQPQPKERTAYLSVLGRVKDVSTFITLRNGAIFRLFLFRPMEADVQLYIQYTDVESGNMTTEITQSRYSRLNEIAFFIEGLPRTYKRFFVDVALVSGELQGPLYRDGTVHDLSVPTDLSETLIIYLAPSVCALLAFVIIATIATVFLCARCCSSRCTEHCFSCSGHSERKSLINKWAPITIEEMRLTKVNNNRLEKYIKGLRIDNNELRSDNNGLRSDIQRLRDDTQRLRSLENGIVTQEVYAIPSGTEAKQRLRREINPIPGQCQEEFTCQAATNHDVAHVRAKGAVRKTRKGRPHCLVTFCCVGRKTEADRDALTLHENIVDLYKRT